MSGTGSAQNAQVFQQDFQPHQDEDDAARQLSLRAEAGTEYSANPYPGRRQKEGDGPDEDDGGQNFYI